MKHLLGKSNRLLQHGVAWAAIAAICTADVCLGQPGPGPVPIFVPFAWPGPMGSMMLLMMPEVVQELQIREDQRPQIEKLLSAYQQRMQEAFGTIDLRALGELTDEERAERFAELRQLQDRATREALESLAEVLDEKQRERFEQLRLQHEGTAALNREDVAQKLKLTAEQREQIRRLLEPRRPESPAAVGRPDGPGGPGGPGPFPDFEAMRRERAEAEAAALALLTEEQRAAWDRLRGKPFAFPAPQFGPGGPGFMGKERKLLAEFDSDANGWLNAEERAKARTKLAEEQRTGRSGRGMGPFAFGPTPFGPGPFGPPAFAPGGMRGPGDRGPRNFGPPEGGPNRFGPGGPTAPPQPGPAVSVDEVPPCDAPLYDPAVLRTLFLEFEAADWEAELADFYNTDVDVAATLVVDGRRYENVGVHFRGMSSYAGVPPGYKRSLNISLDLADPNQRLYGYKTLNLLNAHGDPTLLSTVLYSHIAQQYLPVPKANFVRLVINGESWGVYVNAQQFDKVFTQEHWGTTEGVRWKVRGSPAGGGGLEYLGEDIEAYKQRYELKSRDNKRAWKDLVRLCRTLHETPPEELEAALEPLIDIDELLWFLALDVALINNDGYWIRASDYCMYQDPSGKFHIVPHDMNEAFQPAMGFGPPGGRPRPGFGRNAQRVPGGPAAPPGTVPGPGGPAEPSAVPGARGVPGSHPVPEQADESGPRAATRASANDDPDGRPPGGMARGWRGGPGVELDPLVGLDDPRKPLRSRVLAVPSLRQRYLHCVHVIARDWLDWQRLGPIAESFHSLIDAQVKLDTRKLAPYEAFQQALLPMTDLAGPRRLNLREFCRARREYLLNLPAVQQAAKAEAQPDVGE